MGDLIQEKALNSDGHDRHVVNSLLSMFDLSTVFAHSRSTVHACKNHTATLPTTDKQLISTMYTKVHL